MKPIKRSWPMEIKKKYKLLAPPIIGIFPSALLNIDNYYHNHRVPLTGPFVMESDCKKMRIYYVLFIGIGIYFARAIYWFFRKQWICFEIGNGFRNYCRKIMGLVN